MGKGAVIGGLSVCRKTAGRQLAAFEMICDAFTADSLALAGFIGAVAAGKVLFLFAFHGSYLLYDSGS
jgi:hypothetical protein